jgi:hypothetical protein
MGKGKTLPNTEKPRSTAPKGTRTSGNRNVSRYIDTKTGEFKEGVSQQVRDNPESLEAYRTWMKVKGIKKAFIATFSECGNMSIACNIVGIHPMTVYGWLRTDEAFQEDYNVAVDFAISTLEMEARRRALEGSDRLLEFLLKSLKPEVYRERYEIKQEVSADYVIDISPPKLEQGQDVIASAIDVTPTDVSRE